MTFLEKYFSMLLATNHGYDGHHHFCCNSFNFIEILLFRFQEMTYFDFTAGNLFIGVATGFSNLFVYCFIGYKSVAYYTSVGDLLYQSNWHKLPTKYRRYFVLMIQDAQKPVLFHGFKIIKITLGTFTNVRPIITYTYGYNGHNGSNFHLLFLQILNALYKFYMMLNTLTTIR